MEDIEGFGLADDFKAILLNQTCINIATEKWTVVTGKQNATQLQKRLQRWSKSISPEQKSVFRKLPAWPGSQYRKSSLGTKIAILGTKSASKVIQKHLSWTKIGFQKTPSVTWVSVPNKLTWNQNCIRWTTKAITAFFQVTRCLTKKYNVANKLNEYTGYTVLIKTYAFKA